MGKIVLYGLEASPPVRGVLLTLNALDLPYEFIDVDLFAKANKSEEFLKINPAGTVPALLDDGQAILDSHAIIAYLASKYGKDDSLYPKDLVKRSVVDHRLYFEASMAFERALRGTTKPIIFDNETNVPQQKIDNIAEVYGIVNKFLQDHPYVAGDNLTIADLSLISSISSLHAYLDSDATKYPNLVAWIKRLEQLPYYEKANGNGAKQLIELIKSKNITIVP
ncbi:glutathione S-transferase 1-like [Bactrocera neohumeralis]|uniref:glutathione S-transferase 1-like n=1 Tax=Bactrocera neohumeralis TaxID=98809 RepID=UPI002166C150|nr:glutathione S-transferase 1-like [Bactrocera neohumeralis]